MFSKPLSAFCASLVFLSSSDLRADNFGGVTKLGNVLASKSMNVLPEAPVAGAIGVAVGATPGAMARMNNGTPAVQAYAQQVGAIAVDKASGQLGGTLGGPFGKWAAKKVAGSEYESFVDKKADGNGTIGGIQDAVANNEGFNGKSGITQYNLMQDRFDFGSQSNDSTPRMRPNSRNSVPHPAPGDELIGRVPGTGGGGLLDQMFGGDLGAPDGSANGGGNRGGHSGRGSRQFYMCPTPPC